MDYTYTSYEQFIEMYRRGGEKQKREILESGIDVIDFMKKEMDSGEIVEALTLTRDKEKLLTELIESPDKNMELLKK